ncbi:hypothetical protein T492DRAFT_949584 [Pavlovales sp. CCMP2436]|nr:hypothetical protein T492DRAFT_949584 [Pavlovales sp. CCMP2436]|mmetsp:Transcript_40141/g.99196  ORF Transcript_40141/g.99196 Transcript_40141/m.99196 type:complete len:221 (-) Transcript_40141:402-1064(-)
MIVGMRGGGEERRGCLPGAGETCELLFLGRRLLDLLLLLLLLLGLVDGILGDALRSLEVILLVGKIQSVEQGLAQSGLLCLVLVALLLVARWCLHHAGPIHGLRLGLGLGRRMHACLLIFRCRVHARVRIFGSRVDLCVRLVGLRLHARVDLGHHRRLVEAHVGLEVELVLLCCRSLVDGGDGIRCVSAMHWCRACIATSLSRWRVQGEQRHVGATSPCM